jgi:ribosomal protein S18 acetylase RimI-like enzyme
MTTATALPVVVRLRTDQVPAAARLVARAFDHYEMNRVLVPDDVKRCQAATAVAMTRLYRALPHGYVFAASDGHELQGVAVWLPPHVRPTSRPPLSVLPATARALATYAGAARRLMPVVVESRRAIAAYRRIFRLRATAIAALPQWHLAILATDPRHQRHGVGRRLLAHMLERIEADEVGVWLETNDDRNVRLYERVGFSVTAYVEGEAALPSWWLMQRPPVGAAVGAREPGDLGSG